MSVIINSKSVSGTKCDDVIANSTNPVKNSVLNDYLNNNSLLATTKKGVAEAINEVNTKILALAGASKIKVVEEKPTKGDNNTIYYVGNDTDGYIIWLYAEDAWVTLGSTALSLDEYLKREDIKLTSTGTSTTEISYITLEDTEYKLSIGEAAPIGSILPFAGTIAPNGYLFCDGSAVSKATYAALYEVIGDLYGTATSADNFVLPNLKDKFLEGAGTNALGTSLDAGLPNIEGELNTAYSVFKDGSATASGALDYGTYKSGGFSGGGTNAHTIKFDASKSNSIYGSSDTVQPASVVVNYIIKYKDVTVETDKTVNAVVDLMYPIGSEFIGDSKPSCGNWELTGTKEHVEKVDLIEFGASKSITNGTYTVPDMSDIRRIYVEFVGYGGWVQTQSCDLELLKVASAGFLFSICWNTIGVNSYGCLVYKSDTSLAVGNLTSVTVRGVYGEKITTTNVYKRIS